MKHKTCPRCRRNLPLNAYSKRTDAGDGYYQVCRTCRRIEAMATKNLIPRIQIRGLELVEHLDSITKRIEAVAHGRREPEPFYALPGGGTATKEEIRKWR